MVLNPQGGVISQGYNFPHQWHPPNKKLRREEVGLRGKRCAISWPVASKLNSRSNREFPDGPSEGAREAQPFAMIAVGQPRRVF